MPLVKITLAFAFGILLCHLGASTFPWPFLPAPLLAIITWLLLRKRSHKLLEFLFQGSLLASFTLAGILFLQIQQAVPGNHVRHLIGQTLDVRATATSDSKATKYGQKVTLECKEAVQSALPLDGLVLAYLPAGSDPILEGDVLEVRLSFQPIKTQYEGYRQYLKNKGIHCTAKVRGIEAQLPGSSLWAKASLLRNSSKEVLFEKMPDPEIAGLATAILLGDKSQLPKHLRENFAKAGMSHILAISGLHVGIVFLFLNKLLGFLAFTRAGRIARTAMVLLILLAYMLLTGCAPAVCRAVLMISIAQIGQLFYQQSFGMNTLAAAGFLLLLINPAALLDVGFQLSFAAVAGILLLAPRIQNWAEKRAHYRGTDLIQSASVCLAAQVFTAPLVFYHFGTFPTYFLFANLLLLPIASFSVNLGFVSLLLCWTPGLGHVLLGMLDFVLWVLTALSTWFAELPAATVTRLSLSEPGFCILLLLAMGIAALGGWPYLKKHLSPKKRLQHPSLPLQPLPSENGQ